MSPNARQAGKRGKGASRLLPAGLLAWGLMLALPGLGARGAVDPSRFGDRDGDGYRTEKLRGGTDCDDLDASVYPGAVETCDGRDQDCDDQIDEGAGLPYYPDSDRDGWGAGTPVVACERPAGYAVQSGDCEDKDPVVHPGALELADGLDQDCDGTLDERAWLPALYLQGVATPNPRILGDLDGDGFDDFVIPGPTTMLFMGGRWLTQDFDQSRARARFDGALCDGAVGTFVRLGDVDGDGLGDFGYLCAGSSPQGAFFRLYRGRASFAGFDLSAPDGSIVSSSSTELITTAAMVSGDLNADGFDDILLGLSASASGGTNAGKVVAFLGGSFPSLGTLPSEADIVITGRANEHLGVGVENVGDLNADGYPEVFVTDFPDGWKQRLQAFDGLGKRLGAWSVDQAQAVIYSETSTYGLRCGLVGDLTGDGTDDLAMSDGYTLYLAESELGAWYLSDIVLTMSSVASVKRTFATPSPDTWHHLSILSAGDVNADGLADMVLGDWGGSTLGGTSRGVVYWVLGVVNGEQAEAWPVATAAYDHCSSSYCQQGAPGSFHGPGDLNGDGHSDLLVGGLTDVTAVILGL